MVCLYPKSAESLYETVFACSGCSASIVKNKFKVFERLENLLQNGILHFVFRLSVRKLQSSVTHNSKTGVLFSGRTPQQSNLSIRNEKHYAIISKLFGLNQHSSGL